MLHASHALAAPAPWWCLVCYHPSGRPSAREKGNVYENQPRSCIPLLFPIPVWTSLLLLLGKAGGQPFLCPWHWAAVWSPSLWKRLWLLSWQALQTLCSEAESWRGVLLVWEAREEFWPVALASGGFLCCFFEHRIGFRFRAVKELLGSSGLGRW